MKRMLPALLKLLLVLAAVSRGTATFCKDTEGEISAQYYGTVGQSVVMHLANSSIENSQYELFFKCEDIFRSRSGRTNYSKDYKHRFEFLLNGNLRLYHAMKSDSGIYTFIEFYSNGTHKRTKKISLTIQENVVLPVVLGVCLLLMVLLLGTCCLYKKKQKQPATSQRSAGDRCEDPQELVYCQVQVVKKKERPKKQEQDPQVVYGEVKVSGDSKAIRHTPNEQADTIYSGIRT